MTNSELLQLADGVKRSGEAAALLAATVDSTGQFDDAEVRQLAQSALEAVDRLQERLQLLDEAYRIADRHRAADLVISGMPALALADPLVVGSGIALAQTAVEGL
jgi:hypothetical protein